jgi:hypothetical protein
MVLRMCLPNCPNRHLPKLTLFLNMLLRTRLLKGLVEGLIKLHEVNNSSTSGSFAFVHISPESKQNMVAKFTKSQHKSGFSKPVSLRNFACFTLIYTKYGYRISQLFYIIFFNGIFFNATILRLRLCFDLHRCTFDCENCGFSTQSMNKDYHIRKGYEYFAYKTRIKMSQPLVATIETRQTSFASWFCWREYKIRGSNIFQSL